MIARALFGQFHARVTGGEPAALPEALAEEAERLDPLTGVKAFPGIVNLAARGTLVVSVARRLGSEGPLLAYCAARSNRAGPQRGALGPLS
jgi:hypothetical protein